MWEFWCVVILAIVISVFSVIVVIHSSVCCLSRSPIRFKKPYGNKSVLLVIAHPDDECMFFTPTILMLQQVVDAEIHLLCLSTGNFYGEGKVREEEMAKSCKTLGIDKWTVINDEKLPDNPEVSWDGNVIADYVSDYIRKENIEVVISFDKRGISGHPNHVATYEAIRRMVSSHRLKEDVQVFFLETTNLIRKYIGLFDLPWSLLSTIYFVLTFSHVMQAQEAMRCYRSQYLWFRRLYIHTSRYMIMNTLIPANETG